MPFDVVYYKRTDTKFENPLIYKAKTQEDAEQFKSYLRSLDCYNIKNEAAKALILVLK